MAIGTLYCNIKKKKKVFPTENELHMQNTTLTIGDNAIFGKGILQGLLRGVEAQTSDKKLSFVRHDVVSMRKNKQLMKTY